MKNKSFTLIEILVVIIIIGILASVVLFSTNDSTEKRKRLEVLTFSEGAKGKSLDSLISEWNFDGPTSVGSAATNADVKDSWGHNDGVVYGGPIIKGGEDCVVGKCLQFDGFDDYIDMGQGASDSLKIINSQTIEYWVYPTDMTVRRNPIAKAYGGEGTIVQEVNGYMRYYYGTAGGNAQIYQGVTTSRTIKANEWNHLAVVRNLEVGVMEISWYLNGQKITSNIALYSPAVASTLPFYIAKGYCSNFIGKMDQIRIYKKAIATSEIKQNYIAGLDSLYSNNVISKEEYNQRTLNLAQNEE